MNGRVRATSSKRLRQKVKFAVIPEWVLHHEDLSAQSVRLYGVLQRFAELDEVYPGRRLLATRMGTSVKTVDRALDELQHVGAVTVTPRFNDAGDQTSNDYDIHMTPTGLQLPGGDTGDQGGGDTGVATGGDTRVTQERAISRDTPLPPAGRCARHPNGDGKGCRACGTTNRQLDVEAKRDAVEKRRAEELATLRAQQAADQAARARTPSPAALAAKAQIRTAVSTAASTTHTTRRTS